jgi:hypothetical protein
MRFFVGLFANQKRAEFLGFFGEATPGGQRIVRQRLRMGDSSLPAHDQLLGFLFG